ncbi:DUF1850 domain-containing protein [Marinimicrococcus flavescens]|uniref:DUF1850 domain-containing protein n=1 Tax=Marinimicrococcus flavescens TaxID=3031815 RepID=A0AAP3XTI6_9PROT|nr:DUF1850 domain-containing protein [Marinimicrococcus flavescens]
MSGLCLVTGAATVRLAVAAFTLAWTHSVEKILWEEDYRVEHAALVLVESRVRGSGAGMEPPEGSVLENGAWRYRPDLPPLPALVLARSGATADWRLCPGGEGCRPLGSFLPDPAAPQVTLRACAAHENP